MKKTIIFASVALATLFAFSSCQKENLQDNGTTNGVRIITAEFENNATKTDLNSDGVTPEWKAGDVIRILGTAPNEYADITLTTDNIKNEGRTITFGTSFTGALYAVYPASATTMTSCPDGEITFTIPAIQDGTFGSANICVAKSTEDDGTNKDNLIFRNATAVLKITTSSAVVGVDVTATNFIAGEVTATFSGTAISLTTTSLDRHYVSAVGTSAPTGNVFYLATAPVTTGAAKVNCYTTEKKGTVEKESKNLSKNIIYNMDLTSVVPAISNLTGQHGLLNGHEGIVVKIDGTLVAVATMNVGAGSVNGSDCFGDTMTYDEACAACAAWGGWRLPTVDELTAFCHPEYSGVCGDTQGVEGGTGAVMWDIDGVSGIDLYLPLNDYDDGGENPSDIYWTGTTKDGGATYYYFAPAIEFDGDYPPLAPQYIRKGPAAKDSKFLVRLFHDLP